MKAPPQEISQLVAQGALFVANHSGGKDSQAMLIDLLATIPSKQLLVAHASLGHIEWPGALEHAQNQAKAAGLPFIVARATKTLFEMVQRRHQSRPEVPSWPSAVHRQCTSDLKRGPIQREVRRYAKEHGFKVIVNCLGLRATESANRSKKQPFRRMDSTSNSVLEWFEWLPIHGLSTAAVFARIADSNQQPHYAYQLGNDRLSCVFCIMGSRNDLQIGAANNPRLLADYHRLEVETGYTMHQSRKPIIDICAVAG